ncbi:MAG: ribonuclease E/G, partial [Pseudomonadota bacterium]
MKGRVIALEMAGESRSRAALIIDGRLDDLLIDADPALPRHGQIFAAIVERSMPNMPAAFARLPGGQTAYVREARKVRTGDRLIVQVTGYPDPGKAYPATTEYLLKSRTAILTPGRPGVNVSRSLRDPELRQHVQDIGSSVLAEHRHGGGLILRSDSAHAEETEIVASIEGLIEDDEALTANFEASEGAAALLNDRADWQAERDWLTDDTDVATEQSLGTSPFEHFGVWE